MDYKSFKNYTKEFNLVPIYKKITADFLTPVSVYSKFREESSYTFLLESMEGIGRFARYSFIGFDPYLTFYNYKNEITQLKNGSTNKLNGNIFDYLTELINDFSTPNIETLPDFSGGLVGFLGFENVSSIENVISFNNQKDDSQLPDSFFGLFKIILAFDHFKQQLIIVNNVIIENDKDSEVLYHEGLKEIKEIIEKVNNFTSHKPFNKFEFEKNDNPSDDKSIYEEIVRKSKKNIVEGDVFQIVPSNKFETEFKGDLFNVYRALRTINPSPYMYFLDIDKDLKIIGSSPEDLLKVKDDKAAILPIAGTRPRGKTITEDKELEEDLLNDPKEIAEHNMLVDLARNDLGRVCRFDSIDVVEKMNIHRFSHVMHIVSRVEGILREDKNCIDALKASFPAGTVTGAPKIKAIQLLSEYESMKRGIYGGAVGYIDFKGNLDLCIAIRTLFSQKNKLYWQAGAGIVQDSVPENEFNEVLHKSEAMRKSLNFAEVIDENIND